jgi:flagellin-like protein
LIVRDLYSKSHKLSTGRVSLLMEDQIMYKKIWKMRKDKSAVSPVIATILMVAITVVLAAVLYVMVMGFGGSGGSTPTASLTSTKSGSLNYTITVQSVSVNTIQYTSIQIVATGSAGVITPSVIHHAVAGSTTLGAGDYFTVQTTAAGPVTVAIRDTGTSNNIASLVVQVTA